MNFLKRIFYFGHGRSYNKTEETSKHDLIYHSHVKFNVASQSFKINVDKINNQIALSCPMLSRLGIFYQQNELRFDVDSETECQNKALFNLLIKCNQMREISYLKSFKVQKSDDFESTDLILDRRRSKRKQNRRDGYEKSKRSSPNSKSYFHFIKYAIQNATNRSKHVDMRPCYGFDMTQSAGHLLDKDADYIETTLPRIPAPRNDFHSLLKM